MFTPPPSPLPVLVQLEGTSASASATRDRTHDVHDMKVSPDEIMQQKVAKGRRTTWAILLVPAVLILVALSSHHLTRWQWQTMSLPLPLHHVDVTDMPLNSNAGHPIVHRHHRRSPQALELTNPINPSTTERSSSATRTTQTSESAIPQTLQPIPPAPTVAPPLPTPFPRPFDSSGLSGNFSTQGCKVFMTNMTVNSEPFLTCRPLSMLVQFSSAFLEQAQENLTALTVNLYGTCNTVPSAEQCVANMGWFAQELQVACETDLADGNAVVSKTLLALQAYGIMRRAGCLTDQKPDPSQDAYCYVDAVHAANPSDLYLYQLPMGVGLPSSATPSCSACSQSVLAQFAEGVKQGNVTGLADTYEGAARQAVAKCGEGYAQVNLASAAVGVWRGNTDESGRRWGVVVAVVCALAAAWMS